MQEQVSVLLSTDITSTDLILKRTTLSLCNNSQIPIFIPTEKFTILFSESICFEFSSKNSVIPLPLSSRYGDVRFSPTYYRLEPSCSVSRTFFGIRIYHNSFIVYCLRQRISEFDGASIIKIPKISM